MPPRRMRNQGQDMRNPFGMRQQRGFSGFGMQQPGRNRFGMGQTQPPPFQFGGQRQNQGFNMGMNQRGKSRGPGKGGLLSKLLKKGDNQNAGGGLLQQFSRGDSSSNTSGFERSPQAAGGILQSLLNPGNVNSFLSNTQQMLQTAQQLGPMFQQYGPMVKNIPALWKLYRGFKDMPADDASDKGHSEEKIVDNDIPEVESTVKKKKKKKPPEEISEDSDLDDNHAPSKSRSGSKPKLYI
ncbi:YqfQ family protein [Rossellomorea aquimaris]|uniref:YqfQ family protein n=1 Tax=Bacillaceae TaxID=186817 RepID=UPI0021CD8104|nr:YqfQ family protein [Bacillus sp. CH30_1T]